MIVLGIETTAHTFGAGIASSDGRILANENLVYIPAAGGIHPREAAEHSSREAHEIIFKALRTAGMSLDDVDAIAVTLGPGLGPCLRVGCTAARAISLIYDKPLVPVNHCIAHVEIARLTTRAEDPLVVYVSGGNTIISAFSGGRYRVFGETLDIALGNCLDVFAREVGLPQPGTPHVEKLALEGREFVPLPYVVKGQDMSFSGLLTAAINRVKEGYRLEDVCLSLIEVAYGMLVEVAERASAHTRKEEVVLTGGVAKSRMLQSKLRMMAEEHGASFNVVPDEYAGDNGAMVAWTGLLAYERGVRIGVEDSHIRPKWRIDEVKVPWREGL